jgi:phage-related protein
MPLPPFISGIPEGLAAVFRAITGRRDEIKAAVMGVWEKLNALADFVAERIQDASTWLFDHIWGATKHLVGLTNVATQFLGATFARGWKSVFDALARTAQWAGMKIFKAALDVIEHVGGLLGDVWNAIRGALSWIDDFGKAIWEWIMNFPDVLASSLAGAVYKVADAVGDAIDQFIDEHWED